LWSGLFLRALLSNLGRPESIDFFHNNQNDPGYRQWRAEADRRAQNNADLRQRLDELDRELAARDDQPRDPGALPADVPPEIAKATPSRTPDAVDETGGSGWVWIVVLAGGSGIAYLAWRRRHSTSGGSSSMSRPPANALQSAGSMLRHKLSGEGYTPSKFRVGMTLALDPTPFILAAGAIKLPQPEGMGQVSVSSVGHIVAGNTQLVRLYLPNGHPRHRDAPRGWFFGLCPSARWRHPSGSRLSARRPLHHHESGRLQVLDQPVSGDPRHELVGLMDSAPTLEPEGEHERLGDLVGRGGGGGSGCRP
jgi:hypothetical protein